jgi:hypothetical protein
VLPLAAACTGTLLLLALPATTAARRRRKPIPVGPGSAS